MIKSIPSRRVYRDQSLYQKLRGLTLGYASGSWMASALESRREGTMIVAYDGEVIIGWGFLTDKKERLQITVYVNIDERRKGHGTEIVKRAKLIANRRKKELVCSPWDHTSRQFFADFSMNQVYAWT